METYAEKIVRRIFKELGVRQNLFSWEHCNIETQREVRAVCEQIAREIVEEAMAWARKTPKQLT